VSTKFGTGGNNCHFVLDERKQCAPLTENIAGSLTATGYSGLDYKGAAVYFEPQTMKLREGQSGSGGRGPLIQNNKSATLSTSNEQTLFQPTYAIQGNLLNRKDGSGPAGIGFREDAAYTVNTVDNGGAVAYQKTVGALCSSDYKGIRNQDIGDGKAIIDTFGNNGYGKWNGESAALKASGGDMPGSENVAVKNRYAVRRLTVLECLRLQGFPDFWLDNIHISEPTAEQIEYWRGAFAELGKKKTDSQIKKFLANPYTDSNAYRAIGNSLAVPCALFVMRGIAGHSDM
jgi:DNA (cytosine-5)-methyltransferase 1